MQSLRIQSKFRLILGVMLLIFSQSDPDAISQELERPIEAGRVDWQRDFAAAQTIAAQTKRPLFVLFQEVPG